MKRVRLLVFHPFWVCDALGGIGVEDCGLGCSRLLDRREEACEVCESPLRDEALGGLTTSQLLHGEMKDQFLRVLQPTDQSILLQP